MDWVIKNIEWVFGGIGCTIIAGLFQLFYSRPTQNQKIGKKSLGIQAGADVTILQKKNDE
jgi:hypothetical protein